MCLWRRCRTSFTGLCLRLQKYEGIIIGFISCLSCFMRGGLRAVFDRYGERAGPIRWITDRYAAWFPGPRAHVPGAAGYGRCRVFPARPRTAGCCAGTCSCPIDPFFGISGSISQSITVCRKIPHVDAALHLSCPGHFTRNPAI